MKYAIPAPTGLSQEQFSDWMDGCLDCMAGRKAKVTRSQAYLDGYGRVYAEEQRVTRESINENQ